MKGKINTIKPIIKLTFQVLWLMFDISVFKLTIYSNGFFVFVHFLLIGTNLDCLMEVYSDHFFHTIFDHLRKK